MAIDRAFDDVEGGSRPHRQEPGCGPARQKILHEQIHPSVVRTSA